MLEKGKRWLFISQGMEGNEETSCSADVINEETSYSGSETKSLFLYMYNSYVSDGNRND